MMDYSKLKLLLSKIGSTTKLEAMRTAKETADVAKGLYKASQGAKEAGIGALKNQKVGGYIFPNKILKPSERLNQEKDFLLKLLRKKKRGVGAIVAGGAGVGAAGYGAKKMLSDNDGDE